MQEGFIPLAIPNLAGNERRYLNQCIDDGFVSSVGEFVNSIERMGAESTGAAGCVATSSGTTAIQTMLIAVGVRPGDLVIVPSFTFIASANAVSHCGASPWFFDISIDSWTIDPDAVEDAFSKEVELKDGAAYHAKTGRRVAAIMPVYTLGNVADMDALIRISESFGIPLVADAACALGARYKGKGIGNLASLSAASLNGNKTVTAGGGGLIIGDSERLLQRCKHLSTTARISPEYDFDEVGYNYRMTNLQAAVGCAQLEMLDAFVARKREIRSYYNDAFAGIEGIASFPVPAWCESACWFSGIVIERADHVMIREYTARLLELGIETRSFWKPVHEQKPYVDSLAYGSLSNTRDLWEKILTLPCSTSITDEELERVVDAVNKVVISG